MDKLICPLCGGFPLSLSVDLEERVDPPRDWRPCERYCAFLDSEPGPSPPCGECLSREVVEGRVACPRCGAVFWIEGGVLSLPPASDKILKWFRGPESAGP